MSRFRFEMNDFYREEFERKNRYQTPELSILNNSSPYQPQFTSSPAQPFGEYAQNTFAPNFGQNTYGQGNNFGQNAFMTAAKYIDPKALASEGIDAISSKVEQTHIISSLRQHFDVDITYIVKRMYFLLFPFFQKDWGRVNEDLNVSPRLNHNALDLYIPVMSFLTYVFVCSLSLGYHDLFSPEALGSMVTKGIVCLIIEVLLLMLVFSITGYSQRISFVYMLCLCAYKYTNTVFIVITSFIIPWIRVFVYLYFTIAYISFQFRKLRCILASTNSGPKKSRAILLLILAICQPVVIYMFCASPISPTRPGYFELFSKRSFF